MAGQAITSSAFGTRYRFQFYTRRKGQKLHLSFCGRRSSSILSRRISPFGHSSRSSSVRIYRFGRFLKTATARSAPGADPSAQATKKRLNVPHLNDPTILRSFPRQRFTCQSFITDPTFFSFSKRHTRGRAFLSNNCKRFTSLPDRPFSFCRRDLSSRRERAFPPLRRRRSRGSPRRGRPT